MESAFCHLKEELLTAYLGYRNSHWSLFSHGLSLPLSPKETSKYLESDKIVKKVELCSEGTRKNAEGISTSLLKQSWLTMYQTLPGTLYMCYFIKSSRQPFMIGTNIIPILKRRKLRPVHDGTKIWPQVCKLLTLHSIHTAILHSIEFF